MYDTGHPDPLGHADDGLTPAAEALHEARERARETWAAAQEAHEHLLGLMTAHLRTFLKAGDEVKRRDGELTANLVVSGHGSRKGQLTFKLAEDPCADLQAGRHPVEAHWTARAFAILADGKTSDTTYRLSSPLFPMPDPNCEVESGEPWVEFCDAFVDNWICSTPETYQRLKPAARPRLDPTTDNHEADAEGEA